MSDFLDNLIAKSLGLTEVVAPRPMSLFEPLPSDAGPLAPEYYSLEQNGAPPAPRAAQSIPSSQHIVQVVDGSASQVTPLPIPNQPAPLAPVAGDADYGVDRSEHVAPASQQAVNSHPAAPEHKPLRVILQATPPADRHAPTATGASPLIPAHTAPPESAMTPPESIASVSTAPPESAMTPPESIASVSTPPPRTLLIAPSPDQERGSKLSDRAAVLPSAPEAEAPAAPTIKITIGRVDVRAVMPDKEAPRPAPERRNPALSLEEYLKQRSGGKL